MGALRQGTLLHGGLRLGALLLDGPRLGAIRLGAVRLGADQVVRSGPLSVASGSRRSP
jgi:hypothetical protein